MTEIEEDGVFALWRVQALASMVRLLASEGGGNKHAEAIKLGSDQLKRMSRADQMNPEANDLQLAMSEARLGQAKLLKESKGNETTIKGLQREARETLTAIARRPGDHQAKSKKLLSELGVEVVDPAETKLPVVRNFETAFKEAKIRLERAESSQLSLEILNNRLKETSGADHATIQAELKATQENAARDRDHALQLLKQSLRLYRSGDSRDDLLTARFYIAYLLIKLDKYWEAAAVSDFVARSATGTETGLKAAAFALFGFSKLSDSLPEDRKMSVVGSIESLAQHMIRTWPEAEETQQATLTLLQLALRNKQWQDAERFLELMPKSSTNRARRDGTWGMSYGFST